MAQTMARLSCISMSAPFLPGSITPRGLAVDRCWRFAGVTGLQRRPVVKNKSQVAPVFH